MRKKKKHVADQIRGYSRQVQIFLIYKYIQKTRKKRDKRKGRFNDEMIRNKN